MRTELFKAALKQTQTTWQRYMVAYCLLLLAFVIDWLGKSSFLSKHQPIELAGFKVVPETISFTYAVLFLVFVVAALLESRILKQCADAPDFDAAAVRELPDVQLWLVSPFSTLRFGWFWALRFVFWALFFFGYVMLTIFIAVHLIPAAHVPNVLHTTPNICLGLFKAIGWFALAVLLLCIPPGWEIRRSLRAVSKAIFQPPKQAEHRKWWPVGHAGDF